MIILLILTTSLTHFLFRGLENILFEHGSETTKCHHSNLTWFTFLSLCHSLVKETQPVVLEGRNTFNHQSYPSMDYKGLFQAVMKISEVVPVVEVGVQGWCFRIQDIQESSQVPMLVGYMCV